MENAAVEMARLECWWRSVLTYSHVVDRRPHISEGENLMRLVFSTAPLGL